MGAVGVNNSSCNNSPKNRIRGSHSKVGMLGGVYEFPLVDAFSRPLPSVLSCTCSLGLQGQVPRNLEKDVTKGLSDKASREPRARQIEETEVSKKIGGGRRCGARSLAAMIRSWRGDQSGSRGKRKERVPEGGVPGCFCQVMWWQGRASGDTTAGEACVPDRPLQPCC